MAATIKPKVTEGPAFWAAAAAVLTNNPAPMIAPIPSATNEPELNVRLRPFSESLVALGIGAIIGAGLFVRTAEIGRASCREKCA